MKLAYNIERLNTDNLHKLHELFQSVFKKKVSINHLYNKYNTTYLGEEYGFMGLLALDKDGAPLSFCGRIPCLFNIEGNEYIGVQYTDGATAIHARGQGISSHLNQLADELSKSANATFVFGFPNDMNLPILVKHSGWQIVDYMELFIIPIKTLPLYHITQKTTFTRTLYEKYINHKLKNVESDTFIKRKGWNGIIHNQGYRNYKSHNKAQTLRLKNGDILLKITDIIYIGDIELSLSGLLIDLIRELIQVARSIGIHKIVFSASSDLTIVKNLSEYFKPVQGGAVGVKLLQLNSSIDLKKLRFTYGDYDTF